MELRDLIVTPIVIALVYMGAYLIRPYVTDEITRRYFLPALTVRIIGALAVGFIYQFYYDGGDTFNYHTHGSRIIWEAFFESPLAGLKLLWTSGNDFTGVYKYASKIIFYSDPDSYFVIRIAAFLDLLTFSSYAGTSILFSVLSFVGAWMMYLTFYNRFSKIHFGLAIAILFFPSVIFWGSGLLKDTVVLASLGILTYSIDQLERRRFKLINFFLLVLGLGIIFSVKKYVLLCFLPASLMWFFGEYFLTIKSAALKVVSTPILLGVITITGYWAVLKIGEDDPQYSIENLARTAKITAYDIGFYTGRDAGSSYTLGSLDGTFLGMLRRFPQAVNVSLFRPYLWEVRNPLMLLSALESLFLLVLTLWVILRIVARGSLPIGHPILIFCMIFSVTFAFAVGVSTYNFGTLARYKIPLLPFYILTLVLMKHFDQLNRERKLAELEATENS